MKVLVPRWICLLFVAFIVSPPRPSLGVQQEGRQGIVVETITTDLEADKAGLKPGDIILRWTRSDARGEVSSPFDLSAIEIEQAPRGNITLEGLRGAENLTWTMGATKWGATTRPQLSAALLSHYKHGQELAKAGKLGEAAEDWKKASSEAGDSTKTWLLFQVAGMWADARRWDETDKAFQEAIETAKSTEPLIRAQWFLLWGDSYRNRSDWKNAEACYERSIAEIHKLGSQSLIDAKVLNNLGVVSRQRGDFVKAEEYHRQALKSAQRLAPGTLEVAASLHNLGNVAYLRGDLAKAEDYHLRALEIKQRLAPGSLDLAGSFNSLGGIAWTRGDLARAEDYLLRALEIRQQVAPGSLDVAGSFNNLGLIASNRGNLAKAEEYYHHALDIQEKLAPDNLDVAKSLENLGNLARNRGDLTKAQEYLQRALEIEQRLAPDSPDVSGTFNNLGNVAGDQGDIAREEAYYRKALEIRQKIAPDSLDAATSLDNMGLVIRELGDLVKANEYLHQSLEIREKLAPGSLEVASSLDNLGVVARERGELAEAEEYQRQALAIRQRLAPGGLILATSLTNVGDLASDNGDLAKAEECYQQALEIRQRLAPGSKEHAESLAGLAGIMRRKGQTGAAVHLSEQALDAFESQTARLGGTLDTLSTFRADHSSYFVDYIDLLMDQNQQALAFHVAERWRARSLLEVLREGRVDVRKGVDADLRDRERSLQESLRAKADRRFRLLTSEHSENQVAQVENEIADLRREYDMVQSKIRANNPVYAALTQPKPLTAAETQQLLLDDDTVLLEYALGEKHSYLWAITRSSLVGYTLPARSKIEVAARQLHKLISKPRPASPSERRTETAEQASALLSRMVLGPVASEIRGKRLVIVRDGALQFVSFAALPVPGKPGLPLMAEHEIVYEPSASVLSELRRQAAGRKPAPKAVMVLADPVFDKDDPRVETAAPKPARQPLVKSNASGSTPNDRLARSAADVGLAHLSRLAFSGREAGAIMAVTPPGQGKEALGFEANRTTATSPELAQFRIVHFATHALSDNLHPEWSGLVLSLVDARGEWQDGFLDLQEIYNMNLPAELVVLSACETGLGKDIKGEGMVGLTRGFMYAGATRVVASLWNADDVATMELMEKFYKGMEQQGLTPAAALRQAQLSMWKQPRWKAPYYWAAFQLQGEWR